jgi:alkylhydroperoxidase/carboxymuconolactone decarboxylase family protein YurZ
MSAADSDAGSVSEQQGLWGPALGELRTWDPGWADRCAAMSMNPWNSGVLTRKFIELVSVALNASCTNLDAEATRRHVRAALEAGATRDEILFVLKCATVVAIHSCSVAAPILLEEAAAAGISLPEPDDETATPACDAVRAAGQWNTAWDPFAELDPQWTDQFMATGIGIYQSDLMSAKDVELLSIAIDASYTHLYVPGIRRHIKGALQAGASVEEIMEVLKLCVAQGVQACNLAVPILAEEIANVQG